MDVRETGAAAIAWLGRVTRRGFGLLALIVTLAVLASLPIVQILSLGYLLVAGARVARSGSLRGSLPGLAAFEQIGAIVLGFWLLVWIPRLIASLAEDAALIDPGGDTAVTLEIVAIALAVVLSLHGIAAILRGGRLRYMLLPRPRLELRALRSLGSREGYRAARRAVWDAVASLELAALLAAGLRGFAAAAVWLLVPTTLLALGSNAPPLAVLGVILMAIVVCYLPFVQLRVVEQGRLRAALELAEVHRAQAGAPLATVAALVSTLSFALPLYLLKIELIPREAMWLPGVVFVVLMLPARLVCGLALNRGRARGRPRHLLVRALGRVLIVPIVVSYALALYFSQYLSWYGTWSLYEQHAFLLPVPFLGG